jgi:hypothetical protein
MPEIYLNLVDNQIEEEAKRLLTKVD